MAENQRLSRERPNLICEFMPLLKSQGINLGISQIFTHTIKLN